MDIVSLHGVDGGFDIDRLLKDLLQISLSKLQSFAGDINVKNHPDRMRILVTSIVLAILNRSRR